MPAPDGENAASSCVLVDVRQNVAGIDPFKARRLRLPFDDFRVLPDRQEVI
jgi:hypothetical protein